MSRKQEKTESVWIHVGAGSLSGLFSDTIRARTQVETERRPSLRQVTAEVWRRGGLRAFYAGFASVGTLTIPAHALYFSGYESSKGFLGRHFADGPLTNFLSGFWADVMGSLIWTPMDVVKQRLQVQKGQHYTGSWHAGRTILQEEGPLGLYRGFIPALATYGPYVGIYFALYERGRLALKQDNAGLLSNLGVDLFCGALSAAAAAGLTCPLDVVKTRIQTQTAESTYRYANGFDAVRQIFHKEGMPGFFRGLSARMLWMAPSSALGIASYQAFKDLLQR